MAEITAALVKALREKTGAGMMDAKKALVENNGDEAAAIDWLRAKGRSKAAKKSGRTAADGLVAVKSTRRMILQLRLGRHTTTILVSGVKSQGCSELPLHICVTKTQS